MNKEQQEMQGGYRQLNEHGNVVEEHQTLPRPGRKEQREANAAAADKKSRKPRDPSPAGVDINTSGGQTS